MTERPYLDIEHVNALVKAVTHFMDVGDPDFPMALEATENLQAMLAESQRDSIVPELLQLHRQRVALFRGMDALMHDEYEEP